jgi:hypothetical protein
MGRAGRALLCIAIAGCGRGRFETTGTPSDAEALVDVIADDSGPGTSGIDAFVTPGTSTVGTTQVGNNNQNTANNRVWISKFTLADTCTLQRLVAYFGSGGGQGSMVRGVIYTDVTGAPGTLVDATPAVALPAQMPQTWVALPLTAPISLSAGTYWLGIHDDTAVQLAYQTSVGLTKFNSDTFTDGADPVWAGGTTTYNMQISIYGEYTVP